MTNAPGLPQFLPLPNPLYLSGAGTICDSSGNDTIPFYYIVSETDNVTPELYYITVEGPIDNCTGLRSLQFTRSNFPWENGEGGNGPAEGNGNLDNYIINGRFWRNAFTDPNGLAVSGSTLATSNMFLWTTQYGTSGPYYHRDLAPSQHDTFSMPNIQYIKNILGSTDSITFKKFVATTAPVITGDIEGEYYLNFNCRVPQSGETLKCIQIPISLHNLTLANVPFTFTIQAQSISGTNTISASIYQFPGTGNAASVPVPIGEGTFTINNNWTKYTFTSVFPDTVGLSAATTNDDALYLQINLPMAGEGLCNLNIALPSIYLSTIDIPTNDFETYDQIDAIIDSPRTGDIRTSLNDYYPFGWMPLNGGTIGYNSNKLATYLPTTLNDPQAWPLYNLLWTKFSPYTVGTVNLLAQMINSSGANVAYGGTALSDWLANNTITTTQTMGHVILGTVPVSALLSAYSTAVNAVTGQNSFTVSGTSSPLLLNGTATYYDGMPFYATATGGSATLPGGMSPGTTYYVANWNGVSTFNVALSPGNVANNTLINYSAGSGTFLLSQGQTFTAINTVSYFNGMPVYIANTGGPSALPVGFAANTIYYVSNFNGTTTFTLSTTFANAILGIAIIYANSGTGTNFVTAAFNGTSEGEYAHTPNISELINHNHPAAIAGQLFMQSTTQTNQGNGGTTNPAAVTPSNPTTGLNGGSHPFNVTQPGIFLNMYMKL